MTADGESSSPIPVTSVAQECELIQASSCPCGGRWVVGMQAVYFDAAIGKCCDRIEVTCLKCGKSQDFHFDISAFY